MKVDTGYIAEIPDTHGRGRAVGIPCAKARLATTGIVKTFCSEPTQPLHLADNSQTTCRQLTTYSEQAWNKYIASQLSTLTDIRSQPGTALVNECSEPKSKYKRKSNDESYISCDHGTIGTWTGVWR